MKAYLRSIVTGLFLAVSVFTNVQGDEVYRLFIPQAGTAVDVPAGTRSALTQFACDDIDQNGEPEFDWVMSPDEFPNGTDFGEIAKHYHMFSQDVWFSNKAFFPSNMVTAYEGASAVCLPKGYEKFVFPEDVGSTDPLVAEFPSGRPDWPNGPEVNSAQTCETYSVVMTTLQVGVAWAGVPIVGILKRGDAVIGKIICGIPAIPAGLWTRAVAWAYPFAAAMERIIPATREGLLVPPIVLGGDASGSAIIDFAVAVDNAYLTCDDDIVLVADRMLVPDKRREFIISGARGCLIASIPFEDGQKSYSWQVLNHAALSVVAREMVAEHKPITASEVKEILDAVEEYYNRREDPEPIWVPDPGDPNECPRLDPKSWLRTEAILYTQAEVEHRIRNMVKGQEEELALHLVFAQDAERYLRNLVLYDQYNTLKPRQYPFVNPPSAKFHLAQLTSEYSDPDPLGHHWTLQTMCVYVNRRYVHAIDIGYGRVGSGLTRSDETEYSDLVPAFEFEYGQTSP